MIPQGIEIVQKAIAADSESDYERALALYRDALSRFTLGLKYEKNEARKKLIMDRVEGYMKRAEELSDYLKKQSELDKGGGGGGVAAKSKDGKDGEDEMDADKKKLRGALSAAIVSEKPNVRWEDVAGLENAKDSLKEVRLLPFICASLLYCSCCNGFLLKRFFLTLHHSHRLSSFQQSSLNFLRANANPSRVFFSTALPVQANRTSPKPLQPKRTRHSFLSLQPILFPNGKVNRNDLFETYLKWHASPPGDEPSFSLTKSIHSAVAALRVSRTVSAESRQSSWYKWMVLEHLMDKSLSWVQPIFRGNWMLPFGDVSKNVSTFRSLKLTHEASWLNCIWVIRRMISQKPISIS